MKLKMYQVDAFADKIFTGNPAAVCPLPDKWLEDTVMQNIAMENNLAETAFYIIKNNVYHIRWFTPQVEVDLCGHATLATGHVLFNHENYSGNEIGFESKSGRLTVRKDKDYITLNFPTDTLKQVEVTHDITECFDVKPIEIYKGKSDYMLVFKNEGQIKNIRYNLKKIAESNSRGVIITAHGTDVDFVSRYFAPQCGIEEDPVTGSAHTTLTPYWSKVLHKDVLNAKQISRRTGMLVCRNLNERTEISGLAKSYLTGEISL
jgi:PhzF family phenazine biosynthesis protein